MIENGVTPYVVFDGGLLPSKLETEKERQAYVPLGPLPRRPLLFTSLLTVGTASGILLVGWPC